MIERAVPVVLASLALSCSTADPPIATHPQPPGPDEIPVEAASETSDARPAKTYPCGDAAACHAAGKKAKDEKDMPRARELLQAACDQGSGAGCNVLAGMVKELDQDKPKAVEIWKKACDLGEMDACFNAAEVVRHDDPKDATTLYAKACKGAADDRMLAQLACGRGGIHAYTSGDPGTAAELALASCNEEQVAGCNLLGVLHLEGKGGVAASEEKALELFKRACALGDENGCNNEKKVANSLDVPGANVTMGSITADGFTLTDMQCAAEGAGLGALFLGPAVAKAMGTKKAALDACASKRTDVRVRWTAAGGKITNAEARAGDPKIEACVVKVVKTVPATNQGTCAASMQIGKK